MRTNQTSSIHSVLVRILACAAMCLIASCRTPGEVDPVSPPAPEPVCEDIGRLLAEREVFPARASLEERCIKTQERRAAECKEMPEGEAERCMAEVEQTIPLCGAVAQQLKGEESLIACTAVTACATTTCTVASPCTLPNGNVCTTGTMCNTAGAGVLLGGVCNPGTFIDCVCTQTFSRTAGTCSCGCEW